MSTVAISANRGYRLGFGLVCDVRWGVKLEVYPACAKERVSMCFLTSTYTVSRFSPTLSLIISR